jgi:imidazoleglycerol-phosphate dehydratase
MTRTATIARKTAETDIRLSLVLDGGGHFEVDTGIGFFDHMLSLLAKHGLFDLAVEAAGDLGVDFHHTVEDVGLCLGQAIREAIGDKAGVRRYGFFLLPMQEALAEVALDLSGRAHLTFEGDLPREKVGEFDAELVPEFLTAVANAAQMTLHVALRRGRNTHHAIEAIFKAFAKALDQATSLDPRTTAIPSTKGVLAE